MQLDPSRPKFLRFWNGDLWLAEVKADQPVRKEVQKFSPPWIHQPIFNKNWKSMYVCLCLIDHNQIIFQVQEFFWLCIIRFKYSGKKKPASIRFNQTCEIFIKLLEEQSQSIWWPKLLHFFKRDFRLAKIHKWQKAEYQTWSLIGQNILKKPPWIHYRRKKQKMLVLWLKVEKQQNVEKTTQC